MGIKVYRRNQVGLIAEIQIVRLPENIANVGLPPSQTNLWSRDPSVRAENKF